MWGNKLDRYSGKTGFDFAFGLSNKVFTELRLMHNFGKFQVGLMGKYQHYFNTLKLCDEGCDNEDYLKSFSCKYF